MAIKRGKVKSQTAIEYLITYGWVIIVIAVILGGLIALGVFNPSSYVTSNTCIITPDFNCNTAILSENGILFLNLQQATSSPINITSIACSTNSSTNTVTRVSPQVYLGSGENHTFELPCYSNGYQFSGHLGDIYHGYIIVNYTNVEYDIQHISVGTLILKVQVALPVTTTTTITTTTSTSSTSTSTTSTTSTSTTSSIPPSVTYVPITLSNAQGVPTPAPFQQMISFDPSSYSSYESADLGNIRFYQGSTELYSWCESGCASSSSSAIFWVKLPSGIAANSNTIINMNFESVGTNYDGIFAGAEPQESTTYAQYDNGANVFTFYDNFAGNALSSNWIASLGPGSVLQVSNSITLIPPSGTASSFVYTKSDYGQGVVDFYTLMQAPTGSSNYCASYIGLMTNSLTYNNLAALGSCEYYGDFVGLFSSTSIGASSYVDAGSAFTVLAPYSVLIPSNTPTSISAQVNYGSTVTITTDMPTLQQPIMITEQANGKPIKIIWIRFRAYPPNGVMPTVTLGALS